MWENIWHFVTTLGTNPFVIAIVSSLLASLLTLVRQQIGQFFSSLLKLLHAIVTKQGKDYTFEKAYLNWIINQHRYLGLLPSRIVAARHGEQGRNVDLEKVYVSLHVSTQTGDKNSATHSPSDSYWR